MPVAYDLNYLGFREKRDTNITVMDAKRRYVHVSKSFIVTEAGHMIFKALF